ncbi:MAG: putative manganese-dependent inorganic diphosphatase [Sulfolobales archaeon]
MEVIVVGHRNPDTDSVVSAIALSEFLKLRGYSPMPARAGELNYETIQVLNDCGLSIPALVEDVRPKAIEVASKNVKYVFKGVPVKEAGDLITNANIRSVPVVDENLRVLGIFSVESFSKMYLKDFINIRIKLVDVPLRNIVRVVNCEVVVGELDRLISGHVYVGAMSLKTIRERFSFKDSIVIVGDREEVLLNAVESKASLIIITGGLKPPENVVMKARDMGVPIIVSPYDTYTTAKLVDLSRPVELFMSPAEVVNENTLVHEVVNLMSNKLVRSVVVVDNYGRLSGIITKSDLIKDFRKKLALVDHNEVSQAVEGVEEARIVAVVDHHRVSGDIKTREAILFRIEPVGSTSTILWKVLREYNVSLNKPILKAMLYAVLSDTLLLKSPTTTEDDIKCVNSISSELGVKLGDAMEFIRNAISLGEPKKPEDIVRHDMKVYDEGGYRFAISQVYTVNPDYYLGLKDELLKMINNIASSEGVRLFILLITDYVSNVSHALIVGDYDIVEEAFTAKVVNNYLVLEGMTSRKLQILPKLLRVINARKYETA